MTSTEVDVPPHVGPEVELFRNIGYTLDSALADILDNSLTAGASHVDIGIQWNDGTPVVYVLDDGKGMEPGLLKEAMRIGSQALTQGRQRSDHGRFSAGLKTAAFSIGRQLTVLTKPKGG